MATAPNKRTGDRLQRQIAAILTITVLILIVLNVLKISGHLIPTQTTPQVIDGVIDLDSMTLEQKIAQMIIVAGLKDYYWPWKNMQLGGIHLFALPTEHIFNMTIIDFQINQPIPFFVTADLEGCVTPFAHLQEFPPFKDLKTTGEAYEIGQAHGRYLTKLGFNLNFAPVVDLKDSIWNCRSFLGSPQEIAERAQAYILGLQNEGVIATVKHYPGQTLNLKDPHKHIVNATITTEDLIPYAHILEKADAQAIMVSHIITDGAVDSKGLPAVISPRIISQLKQNYKGLIISDEIHMLGLKNYFNNLDEMYIAVFKAGNDIVLNFDRNPYEIYNMIQIVSDAVRDGKIPKEQIDNSVTKILKAKGLKVN